jgi:hypothetical protein
MIGVVRFWVQGVITRRSDDHAGRASVLALVVEGPATFDITPQRNTTFGLSVDPPRLRFLLDNDSNSTVTVVSRGISCLNMELYDAATYSVPHTPPNVHDCSPSDPIPITNMF